MSASLPVLSSASVSVPASSRIAVYSTSFYQVVQIVNNTRTLLYAGAGSYTSAAFTAATTVEIAGGDRASLFYNVGTAAIVPEFATQPTPGTLNATGTLTAALIFGGIVTSTTAAAVTATLDTGAIMEAAGTFAVGDFVDWTAINTGATNAFTVTAAASGHTVVGAGAVALSTSGRFRTLKTAASTFVTYRLS
jgi:hypothetical protein